MSKAALLCLILVAGCSLPPCAVRGPAIDPQAEALLRDFAKTCSEMTSCTFEVRGESYVQLMGTVQRSSFTTRVALQRPNRLAIRMTTDNGGAEIVSDGTTLSTAIPALKQYRVVELASDDLAAIRGDESMALLNQTSSAFHALPLICLEADPYAALMRDVVDISYKESGTVSGEQAHRLRVEQDTIDLDLWISDALPTRILRVQPDLSAAVAEMQAQLPEDAPQPETRMSVTFSDWNFHPKLPADAFSFAPPAGATKVDSFLDAPGKSISQLVGSPAPNVRLPLLEGDDADLADHRGRHAVVLLFWTTWNEQCAPALAQMQALANAMRKKPVAIYAVNEQEPAARVRAFLKDQAISYKVALDPDGAVAEQFGVSTMPVVILVAPDGEICMVQSSRFDQTRAELLQARLEGMFRDMTKQ